jgi:hypothetical protein
MEIADRLKLLRSATALLLACGAFEPIILTLQKLPNENDAPAFASTAMNLSTPATGQ